MKKTVFDDLENIIDSTDLDVEDKVIYSEDMAKLVREELRKEIGQIPVGKMIALLLKKEIDKQDELNRKTSSTVSKDISNTKTEVKVDLDKLKEELEKEIKKIKSRYDDIKSDLMSIHGSQWYQFGGFSPQSNDLVIGPPNTTGSWRIVISSSNLLFQTFTAGAWTTVETMSITTQNVQIRATANNVTPLQLRQFTTSQTADGFQYLSGNVAATPLVRITSNGSIITTQNISGNTLTLTGGINSPVLTVSDNGLSNSYFQQLSNGVPALQLKAFNGNAVNLFEVTDGTTGEVSVSIDKYFRIRGKVGATSGTTLTAPAPGIIFSHFDDASTTSGPDAPLYTDTLQGNTFGYNGDAIVAEYGGIAIIGITSVEIGFFAFNGKIFTSGAITAPPNFQWNLKVFIMRQDSGTIKYTCVWTTNDPVNAPSVTTTSSLSSLGLGSSGDLVLSASGGTAPFDSITATMGYGEYKPAVQ